jgi:hypothetical protein
MGEPRAHGIRGLAAPRVRSHDFHTVTIQVPLPDSLAAQARELAIREHITVDALVASALTAQLDHTPQSPSPPHA